MSKKCAAWILFLCLICPLRASAQKQQMPHENTLPVGTVTATQLHRCPLDAQGNPPLEGSVCYSVTVNCYDVNTGLLPLTGTLAVATPPSPFGTILLLSTGDGITYFNGGISSESYAQAYFSAGFQVSQLAWAGNEGWQDNYSPGATKSMQDAACFDASIISYVNSTFSQGIAMCVHGVSAGAGALGYALAWYDASYYLRSALFESGPVYSDLEEGCQNPPTVKSVAVCPTGQYGCIPYVSGGWTDFPQYTLPDPAEGIAEETSDDANCANWTGTGKSTSPWNSIWEAMSITAPDAAYSYPITNVNAFLCETGSATNNSAAQGELYFQNFQPGDVLSLRVYGVEMCGGSEDISYGMIAGGESAFAASANAMATTCMLQDARAKLAPISLSFGNQQVGTASAVQMVTLTNSTTELLTISGITVLGANAEDFAQTNTCGGSVGAGGSCTISVTFAPAATGSRSAGISITDDASSSPQRIALSGAGAARQ
jgi:hypothetical protein